MGRAKVEFIGGSREPGITPALGFPLSIPTNFNVKHHPASFSNWAKLSLIKLFFNPCPSPASVVQFHHSNTPPLHSRGLATTPQSDLIRPNPIIIHTLFILAAALFARRPRAVSLLSPPL
jgi:hypothetical protein